MRSLVLTSGVSNRIIDEEDLNDHQQETVNDKNQPLRRVSSLNYIEYIFGLSSLKDIRRI